MKPSFYNTYITLEDGVLILHNKLTGALLTVDKDTKDIIENVQEKEKEIPGELLNTLMQNGIVLHDSADELLQIKYRYNEVCYNPQHLSFVLAPTARCNLSCRYCIQRVDESLSDKELQTATMSDSTVRGVLCFIKNMTETCKTRIVPVTFHGGEPLMAKPLILHMLKDLAQWCRECSFDLLTDFVTNCTLFDQPFLDNLEGYTIGFVRTTLEGPEEIHDQFRHYRNGKGTYEDIVTNMGMLMDAGIRVKVQININKYYRRIPELIDDLKERGLTEIVIEPLSVFDPFVTIPEVQKHYGVLDENFPCPESEYSLHFEEMAEARAFVYRTAFEKGLKLPSSHLGVWTPCEGARAYNYVVGPSGEVYKCEGCILMKNLRIGQIHENGYFERYSLFYEWMDNDFTSIEECQKCEYFASCGGGCIAARRLGGLPHYCEIRFAPEEEYIKMCLKQDYFG